MGQTLHTYFIVIVLSPDPLFFSTSIFAPDTSLMALILLPPRPMTRLIAEAGTCTFLDLKQTLYLTLA